MTIQDVIRWLSEEVPYECKSVREADWARFLGQQLAKKVREESERLPRQPVEGASER